MLPDRFRYVAVEGPIGVGKTSLARRLAKHIAATRHCWKNPTKIPFSPGSTRIRRATHWRRNCSSCSSAATKCATWRDLAQMDLFSASTVSDYLFDKDPLFARLNLGDAEFALYQQIYQNLQLQVPAPDLVIYLQAAPETLVERVHRRARSYEQTISDAYLLRVAQSYSDFFYHYDAAPVLMVNTERLNFEDGDEDFILLLQRIKEMRGSREFFSRGS